jgi:hypothetical protein
MSRDLSIFNYYAMHIMLCIICNVKQKIKKFVKLSKKEQNRNNSVTKTVHNPFSREKCFKQQTTKGTVKPKNCFSAEKNFNFFSNIFQFRASFIVENSKLQ